VRLLLLPLAVVLATIACGGTTTGVESSPSASPVRDVGTVTLSDSGCVYQGDTTFPAGTIVLHGANQTGDSEVVSMLLLNVGHQYSELATHIADEQKRILAGADPIGPPTYTVVMFQELVSPNSTLKLTKVIDVAGTYGLICGRVRGQTALGIWVFGPITVTSSTT